LKRAYLCNHKSKGIQCKLVQTPTGRKLVSVSKHMCFKRPIYRQRSEQHLILEIEVSQIIWQHTMTRLGPFNPVVAFICKMS